jgi:peptide/nickel transport system substrate-binding protein
MGLFLLSCGNEGKKNRDHLVFRYNEFANISSLDPAFAKDQRNLWPCNQLYNGLVQLDENLNVQPDIVKSWAISDSGKTYTFYLRRDVFFHKHPVFGKDSTRKVSAKDFVFSFDRLTDPKIASPGSWVMRNVESYKAVNDSVLKIRLKESFPAFLGLLSMKYCSVVPREIQELDFRESPIGTGPFRFKRWEENEKLVFRKNDLYFEKDENGTPLPYLEAVAITFLNDKQSEFLQFAQGNLDFLSGLDPSYKDELLTTSGELREKYADDVNMKKSPYLNSEYLGFYLKGEWPENNSIYLRKAVNYGFDREKMITYMRNGIGIPANNGFIPKGLPGFGTKGYDYQPEKARNLVQKYIQETGDSQPEIVIYTSATYLDLCEYIQRELQKIGIAAEVNVMPPSTIRQKRSVGQLQVFRASWIADYPDAQNYLSLFYSKNFTPNGPNYTHFHSKKFDELYEKSLTITNDKKRAKLYRKMDSIMISQAPIVPLYYDEVVRFTRKNVSGLGINPVNMLDLRRVKKK